MIRKHHGARPAAVWAAASALLLTACGGAGGGDGNGAPALSAEEIRAVLPDREALPGWQESGEPLVVEKRAAYQQKACPTTEFRGCEGSRGYGLARFRGGDGGRVVVNYQITGYRDERAADAAYDVLWKEHYGRAGGPDARKLDVGEPGDESHARFGTAGSGGPLALVQVRVGTTLLVIDASGVREGDVDAALAEDLTGVVTERARQALNGDTPAGRLGG
ncbi:hypothetical protein KBZ10_12165 [Streptomyces sp. F63]|uniref:hypothetical protein n=1 Tax=Streptomyces sp. F63 TaxID=2824887 RepID=UPI001B35E828|nr:hypothetical protein [Streptomyces sp. F63]MBQ0985262.1 hypothetical protein [Streptomyces sp. F63]